MTRLSRADLGEQFRTFRRSAVRLETRDTYVVENERDPFRRFRSGEMDDLRWFRPWAATVQARVDCGARIARVRLVGDPPSDYVRWEMWLTPHNEAAGEEIRFLLASRAADLHLPGYDYWIFDGERLVLMYFAPDGVPQGGELITDPSIVASHRRWYELARASSQSLTEYQAGSVGG